MLGRLEPPVRSSQGGADGAGDSAPSPTLLRELHTDLVREKRRSALLVSPILLLAALAWYAAWMEPAQFGGLAILAFVVVATLGRPVYDWIQLRRADPLALYEQEQRDTETRKEELLEHELRMAAVRPVATLSLMALVGVVTLLQFWSGPLSQTVEEAGLVKPAVRAGEWWRLLTASYLHVSLFHVLMNAGALASFAQLIETYDRRMRVPLVYLLAVLGGSVVSTFASQTSSVGASGGVLGLAGYLLILAGRRDGPPRWMRKAVASILISTALMGLAAFMFIDNAAHVGGALTGAAIGFLTARNAKLGAAFGDSAGWAAAAGLLLGAVLTVVLLLV